jgi:hypothetical protein
MNLGTALGALLSLVLFGISYRQTIGARKERARIADAEMERTLMKRIVLEDGDFNPTALDRYVGGKAREYRVRVSSLLSPADLLANVSRRILDDDFLESKVRKDVLVRIASMIDAVEGEPPVVAWGAAGEDSDFPRNRMMSLVLLVATTAIVGSLVALIPTVGEESRGETYLAAVGASLALITMALAIVRLREADDTPSQETSLQRAARFEREAQAILKKVKLKPDQWSDLGLDFVVERDGKRIGLDLRPWHRPIPRPVLSRIVKRLDEAGHRSGVEEVLMVVPQAKFVDVDGLGDGFVQAISMDRLERALRSKL